MAGQISTQNSKLNHRLHIKGFYHLENRFNSMSERILLITPVFYGIEKKIKKTLEMLDFEVTWIENKSIPFDYHGTECKLRFLRRLYFLIFSPQKRFIKAELRKITDIKFDYLFSINGFIVCPYLFKRLKKENLQLFSVLFLWDSFSMYSWVKELKFFNKVATFDRNDADKYGVEYLPNFYLSEDLPLEQAQKNVDLFFVGKFNTFRELVLNSIISEAGNAGLKCFIKLWPAYKIFPHNTIVYSFLKLIRINTAWIADYKRNYEAFEEILSSDLLIKEYLPIDEVQHKVNSANVVIDLPYKNQSGYTHRVIDALAKGKKVLTTNLGIRNESFYNSEQIRIIDIENFRLDEDWIKTKASFQADSKLLTLELSVWLKSILNIQV